MAFARLFPINATDARESDRTFSERLLKQSTAAVATRQEGHRVSGAPLAFAHCVPPILAPLYRECFKPVTE
jgi:hypothetical protein